MFGEILKYKQIFWAVIQRIAINMMDNFSRFKISFQVFFAYKAVLFNISRFISKRMVVAKNINTFSTFFSSAIPFPMIFTHSTISVFFVRFAHFYSRLQCMFFSEVCFSQFFLSLFRHWFTFVGRSNQRLVLAQSGTIFCGFSPVWEKCKLFVTNKAIFIKVHDCFLGFLSQYGDLHAGQMRISDLRGTHLCLHRLH